jgi:NAD-reducing hydrogenase large subunit
VSDEGGLEYYDGQVRIVDAEGNAVAEALDPAKYLSYLGEASESWTYVKPTYYRPLGYPGGMYRVGPLARLNVARHAGTPRAERELKEFRQLGRSGVVSQSFHYHYARLIEMQHCLERIEELLETPALFGEHVRSHARPNHREAVGFCEAPRGILWHHYRVDEDGKVERANLLIATQQNNGALNLAVKQAAQRFVKPAALAEGMLNRVEAAIRCFDPCLSCSTHALGQMALVVEVHGPDGALLHRLER